jgi:hypothetical protein
MTTYILNQHNQNIAKVALMVLHQTEKEFDMREFSCRTSCCLVGLGPMAGIERGKEEAWWDYSIRVFGYDRFRASEAENWFFLFGTKWPSRPEQAARRLLYFLDNGEAPLGWNYKSRYYTELGTPELVRRLKAHAGGENGTIN